MNPDEAKDAWEALMNRVKDLAIDAYVIGGRMASLDKDSNGRHVFAGEQVAKGVKLCEALSAFLKARLEAARVEAAKKPTEPKK